MNETLMDLDAARIFAETWHANWCKVDIDAVVSHFSEDAEMRSPLAQWEKGLRPRAKRRSSIAFVELGYAHASAHGLVAPE